MDLPLTRTCVFQGAQAVELDFMKMLIENAKPVLLSAQLVLVLHHAVNVQVVSPSMVSIVLSFQLNSRKSILQS